MSGSLVICLAIVSTVVYKNWIYEQELDSLLWKIEPKDLVLSDVPVVNSKSKNRHGSQVSLTSDCDLMEFRYYNVYTDVGVYKGRVVAIKRLRKKNFEVSRKIKKDLKLVSFFCTTIFAIFDLPFVPVLLSPVLNYSSILLYGV